MIFFFRMRAKCACIFAALFCAGIFIPFIQLSSMEGQQIDGIDHIYLINLDKRKDRLATSLQQLAFYGINPHRFSAVNGRELSVETLKEVALSYEHGMKANRWALTVGDNGLEYAFLGEETLGKPVFSNWMTLGHIGCVLSHISILQEAYDAGYKTIWVFEDDLLVKRDPRLITGWIQKLDALTGENWDILYTDQDHPENNYISSGVYWWMWRPDQKLYDTHNFVHRTEISKDFTKIGSRTRTHSIIIRRSGMEKILNHFKEHRLYLPIDHEIAYASDFNLYEMSEALVTYMDSPSDITPAADAPPEKFCANPWEEYKKNTFLQLSKFTGWCSAQKANRLMDFIYKYNPQLCVEIGTFGGSTTFPLIMALKYQGGGRLFTIDPWNTKEAIKGISCDDVNYDWWQRLDLKAVLQQFLTIMSEMKLHRACTVLHMNSQNAVSLFEDESIDLLYIDGNSSSIGSLKDVKLYFNKVKTGGYIWLNDASHRDKLPAVTLLMQHARWLKEESFGNQCIVFQKISPYCQF